MTRPPIEASWYDRPEWYDLSFRSETRPEADFIEAAVRKYCPFAVRRLFEPGCGTGRLVAELAARGYDVTGLDLNRPSLDYLRRRLARRGLRATLLRADMTDFRLPRLVDAAYSTFNTFRHLLTEADARRHLQCVAASLRPGGVYILGLHLVPLDADPESIERWSERRGSTRVTVTLRVVATDRRGRIERLRVSVLGRSPRAMVRFRDEFPLRLYTAAQFRRLLDSAACFVLCDVYDFWYEIDRPLELNDAMSDTVFILRK